MKGYKFKKNEKIIEIIKRFKDLFKRRTYNIEDKIYVTILETIGEFINCLGELKEIDINNLKELNELYNNIVKSYKEVYPYDIDSEIKAIDNKIESQYKIQPRLDNKIVYPIYLYRDIEFLINCVKEIIGVLDKHYEFSQYEVTDTAIHVTTTENVTKPSYFERLRHRIKIFFGINKDGIVHKSYSRTFNKEEFKGKYLIKEDDINLQSIPKEKIHEYIDGENGRFNKIYSLFCGLSNPREVILENNDKYYYFSDDEDRFIIADKTNTEAERYKNTDTIIYDDDNRYYRIASDNTTIVYEEYNEKEYLDSSGFFIRLPKNSKAGREYVKYKAIQNGTSIEYYFEDERNGMCNINIQYAMKNAIENINMAYESKKALMSEDTPKKIILFNNIHKYELEKDEIGTYKVKHYKYCSEKNEWRETFSLFNKSYQYNQIFGKFGNLLDNIDLGIINLNLIQNGIKEVIPNKVLEIYAKTHPEIAMMIKNYGRVKEINEKEK